VLICGSLFLAIPKEKILERQVSIFRTKNLDDMVAATRTPGGLQKVLGPMDLVLMGIGAIVGTGIFVLTGTGALTAGPALTISFVVAALACGFAALCYAEFASTVPVAGSIYTYSYATLGELVAWMIGWDLMLEYGLATSAVSVAWSGYFQSDCRHRHPPARRADRRTGRRARRGHRLQPAGLRDHDRADRHARLGRA